MNQSKWTSFFLRGGVLEEQSPLILIQAFEDYDDPDEKFSPAYAQK